MLLDQNKESAAILMRLNNHQGIEHHFYTNISFKFHWINMATGTLLVEPFLTVHMLCTQKRLCTNPVKFLLSMLSALQSNTFEPRPNRCSFLTVSFRRTFRRHFYLLPAGSVSIIGFSQKLMLALENQLDESKPEWLAQELGLRRL